MYILHNILFCNCILAFCNITCASSILIHPLLYRNAMSRNHFLQEIIIRGRKTFASWLRINTLRKMAEWLLRGMNLWLAKRQIKFDQNEESSDRILHLLFAAFSLLLLDPKLHRSWSYYFAKKVGNHRYDGGYNERDFFSKTTFFSVKNMCLSSHLLSSLSVFVKQTSSVTAAISWIRWIIHSWNQSRAECSPERTLGFQPSFKWN